MKKTVAFILVLAMALSLSAAAFAVEVDEETLAYEWAEANGVPEEYLESACTESVISLYNECKDLEGEIVFSYSSPSPAMARGGTISPDHLDFGILAGKHVVSGEIKQVLISVNYNWKKFPLCFGTDYISVRWESAWNIKEDSFTASIRGTNGREYETYSNPTGVNEISLYLAFTLGKNEGALSGYVQFYLEPDVAGKYTDDDIYRTTVSTEYSHATIGIGSITITAVPAFDITGDVDKTSDYLTLTYGL